MADEKQIEELLGLTPEDLQVQADKVAELDHLLQNVHEAHPQVLVAVAHARIDAASQVAVDGNSDESTLRGALSNLVFLAELLRRRLQHDNPDKMIVDPSEVH